MNGPDHYREAERLARNVAASQRARNDGIDVNEEELQADLALAQVHATLAQAAATALGLKRLGGHGTVGDVDLDDWTPVLKG